MDKNTSQSQNNILNGLNKTAVFGPTALLEPLAEAGGHHLDRFTDFFRKQRNIRKGTDATAAYLNKNKLTSHLAKNLNITDGRSLTSKSLIGTGVGSAGMISGKKADEDNKMMHSRMGQNFKPKNFIERHPLLTGALSVGIAPHLMSEYRQSRLDKENTNLIR